jgi:hypothetical protein
VAVVLVELALARQRLELLELVVVELVEQDLALLAVMHQQILVAVAVAVVTEEPPLVMAVLEL